MKKLIVFTIYWFAVSSSVLVAIAGAEEVQAVEVIDFAAEVLPVLSDKCFVCHGPDGAEKEILRLDSFAEATRDNDGRRAIDPAALEQSEILIRIHSADNPMPPLDAQKQLTSQERQLLSRWIRQGGEYTQHWAFVPPRKELPTIDKLANQNVADDEMIDAFVRTQLQQHHLDFAPEADRATLARRLALVLTGLPPEPEQLFAFLADSDAGAYERLVDQLLASPYFGEHQARYWLDAVRYGDTHGLHLDNRRAIYPYRDWVIHSLNTNLPLDKFITWQLAGDLLSDPSLEQVVATGFVRLNPSTGEGGAIADEFQVKNNFDRTEMLGTVLLGMSLTCARCHTHKYDPIPQTEYYRLLAFFNNTAEPALDSNAYNYGPVVKAPQDLSVWKRWRELEMRRDELLEQADSRVADELDLNPGQLKRWQTGNKKQQLLILADEQGPWAELKLQDQVTDFDQQITELETGFTTTIVAKELETSRTTRLLERGEYDRPVGEPLEPGILSVMGAFPSGAPRNRLGLARWLTSREHPLVARVIVNRIWQRTFGNGLVRTPEDFGLQGQRPTHPQLLDWLAVELQDSGWDLKHILRLMVTSRTFRQSSAQRDDFDDPKNRFLARGPRFRVDAEVIRDIGLWASGLLDVHMGGEGTKPYQPKGLWLALMHPSSNTKNYVQDKGDKLYRRSLYVFWKRTSPHPMLTLFDAPSRESSCVRRSRTNTSLQSLGLLNETQRIEMSRCLAERLLYEADDDMGRLNRLFILLAGREPNEIERQACTKLLVAMRARYSNSEKDAAALLSIGDMPRNQDYDLVEHAAWCQLATIVLASDAAITVY
mgnify:CR=1 FL=1